MGLVKGYIDDLTYAIMLQCNVTDDEEGNNHSSVFRWVMNQEFATLTEEEIVQRYRKEVLHE